MRAFQSVRRRSMSGLWPVAVAGLAGVALHVGPAEAQDRGAPLRHPISCSPAADAEFQRGLALLHHMTYPAARMSFAKAGRIDTRCAMAHWGIAMTLFQPLWPTRPTPDDLRRGWAAVEAARAIGTKARREEMLIEAAAAFFQDPDSGDYWTRIVRWEKAMQDAFAAVPGDDEIAVFHALAHLAAAPTDTIPRPRSAEAAEVLLAVLERQPRHPGAQHYLVHANDAPGREGESPEIVSRYAAEAPRNPHALHMPTHIQTRQGRWAEVVSGNLRAADAALEQPAGEHGEFVWDEFPHAIEYLVYAALQQGADSVAGSQLARLMRTSRLQPTFKTAFHIASTRARYALERGAWREAMALPVRDPATLDWDRFVWPEAVTWFARGAGAAHEGRLDSAHVAAARLRALEAAAGTGGEPIFARNVRILRLELDAWVAQGAHDTAAAERTMREAAELEVATAKHAVTPGPTLPAHEQLGDLLLRQRRPAAALAAYRRSLELYPRRFNSLLGAARAARDASDPAAARGYYAELLAVAAPNTPRRAVVEARAFVAGRR